MPKDEMDHYRYQVRPTSDGWTVGYWEDSEWIAVRDFEVFEEAAYFASFGRLLNA